MRIAYFIQKALLSVKESFSVAMLTSLTIALSLLVVGSYVLILQNLEQITLGWGRASSITAYIDDAVPQTQWKTAQNEIKQLSGVQKAILVTPKDALEAFRKRGPDAALLVEGITPDILPASIQIELTRAFTNLSKVERIANLVNQVPSIETVDYGKEEFQTVAHFLQRLRYAGLFAGILLGLATILIISNTIRLAVFARKDEIAILRLVGATSSFIRIPFLIEGCVWGLLAGVITWFVFWVAQQTLAPQLILWAGTIVGDTSLHLYDPVLCMILMVTGTVIGGLGSNLALSRFLRAGFQT